MKRRTVIGLGGVTLLSAGGLAWYVLPACATPSSIDVRTYYTADEILSDSARESRIGPRHGEPVPHLATSKDEANELIHSESDAWEFVSSIDFTDFSLVLVQTEGSSTPDLQLRCVRRLENGIELDVAYTTQTGTADLSRHNLFVAINDTRTEELGSVTLNGPDPD